MNEAGASTSASERPRIDPAGAPDAVKRLLEEARALVNGEMDRRLALPQASAVADGDPARRLIEAMRYAALAPGKRLRPALVLAACDACGGARADALPAAAAVELLHTYTLVHDDLPAMDDDDTRRGRPTVHRAYDEATAILAGDGLLTLAFGTLADVGGGDGARVAQATAVLAARSGAWQLLAGQALDLAAAGAGAGDVELTALERIHAGKTGALFAAATELGAVAAGATGAAREALAAYGMALGIAFQHADDLDDHDFPAHAEAAARRRAQLAGDAVARAQELAPGPATSLLVNLARWVGGL